MQDNIEYKLGRWFIEDEYSTWIKAYSNVEETDSFHIGEVWGIDSGNRIVSCVNAMLGIDDPEQWVAMAKLHISASEAQASQNQRLKTERDNLYAALKELVELNDMAELKDVKNVLRGKPDPDVYNEYKKRKHLAWEAARKAIQAYEEDNN